MHSKSLIIIPTYNEKENVERMIDTVLKLKLNFHVLFIDDNSPDGTAKLIELAIEKKSRPNFYREKGRKAWLGYSIYSWLQMGD
jgi:dolichol-phosphate mannosyltransferase